MRAFARWMVPVLLFAPLAARAQDASEPVAREIAALSQQLRRGGSVRIGTSTITRSDVLLDAYERRAHAPLWSTARVRELIRVVEGVRADGLHPSHYHVAALESLIGGAPSPAVTARIDLLASDALLRVSRDLRFGRVEPMGPTTGREAASPFGGSDPAAELERVVRGGSIRQEVDALRPEHFVYRGLVTALAELRAVQAKGGWAPIAGGPALRRDSTDARVEALRERLRLSGDLVYAGAGALFDAQLEAAVKRFQHRHGLNEDGVVGRATLAELNVPVEARIDQLRINLERARWVTHGLPETFVAVNAAGAKVYLVRSGDVAFESRVIVGKEYTRTPVFTAPMRYIDLNPTWTVPPGIVGEVLARVRAEPGYLSAQGMRVLGAGGREVDPAGIDFSRYTARTFPYTFRQDAGPANPLGRIKLVFPNEYNVYLHDTPSRSLFAREERLFSHGCIRVENPVQLAALILQDPRWTVEALEDAIATGTTRTIALERPLQVLILYWTASADLHGELHFYRDVYGRDAELLAALNRP